MVKGGVVLELRLAAARATRDLDVHLTGPPRQMLARLQEAGRLALGDELVFEVVEDPEHPLLEAESMLYEGRRYRVEARLAGKVYGARFGLDVAFAEPIFGVPEELEGRASAVLDFAGVKPCRLRVYPLVLHIAEKLHAYTLPRSRPNSRVKDLPDLALLAGARVLELELRRSLEWSFRHRKTHPLPQDLPRPPESWAPVYARMAEVHRLPWTSLEEVHLAASAFLDPVLDRPQGRWNPQERLWR